VAVVADVRYFGGGEVTSGVSVSRITNENALISVQELDAIQDTLRPPPVTLKPARSRVTVGIRIRR